MPPKCEGWQASDTALGSFTVTAHVRLAEIRHAQIRKAQEKRGKEGIPCGNSKLWSGTGREKIQGKGLREQ